MAERRGSNLAQRMKEKLEEEENAKARALAEREARLTKARAARAELFDDLEAFAAVLEPVACARQANGLVLRRGDRFLHLEPMGEADRVRITFTGSENEDHRLYREPALGDRWVWSFTRRHRGEERLPLFDDGLEELLVLSLQLPRVSAPEDDETSATPAATPTADPFAGFAELAPEPSPAAQTSPGPSKRKL